MTAKWTPEKDADFARMWRDGVSIENLERHFRCGQKAVGEVRVRLGLIARVRTLLWTPEREALAKKLYIDDRRTAAEAARIIGHGATRNAVIGISQRRGWKTKGRQLKSLPSIGPTARRPPKPGQQNRPGAVFGKVSIDNPEESERRRQIQRAESERVKAAMIEPANDTALPLMDRTRFQCSWPVGEPARPAEQMCCGKPVPEGATSSVETYCATHARKAVSRTLVGGKPDAKVYERSMRRFA